MITDTLGGLFNVLLTSGVNLPYYNVLLLSDKQSSIDVTLHILFSVLSLTASFRVT